MQTYNFCRTKTKIDRIMAHLLCDFALPYETAISMEYEKFTGAELRV